MSILKGLEPQAVFSHFEAICSIPHGSGNEKAISDYCVNFAEKQGFKYIRDDANNVIIFKNGTSGYENSEPIILQGHLDMVEAVRPGKNINMKTEPLKIKIFGDKIGAIDTSLGGDDGIAVAISLALLESNDIPHPPLEIILTTDEEVGMNGASFIDLSMLKGKKMINLDSEDEGVFTVGCAGGMRIYCNMPIERENFGGDVYTLTLGGLMGGHSGVEINKGRANSNILIGKLLKKIQEKVDFRILTLAGGTKDNVITPESIVKIVSSPENKGEIEGLIYEFKSEIGKKYPLEKALFISLENSQKEELLPLSRSSTERLINMLFESPFGVQKMSGDIEGLVQTSLNLGVLSVEKEIARIDYSVRSSVTKERDELGNRLLTLAETHGATGEICSPYPAWEYKKDSPLRDKMTVIWKEKYGENPIVCTIHAGLECGLLGEKIENLDAVSIGPDMENIHSCEERLSIPSTVKIWEFLKAVLKEMK